MYRFSLSLTRDLHIEDLRIALLSFICAKQNSKQFIVRIDDIDRKKTIEGKDAQILDLFAIFTLSYDGLYYQSENFKYHLQFASFLMDKGKAFACFCSEKELKKSKTYNGKCINISQDELLNNNLPFVIRIKKPTTTIDINDAIKGKVSFNADEIDSFVIMEKEKYPTSVFASACDDMIQGVTTVLTEEKNLLDAPRGEFIRQSLGYCEEIEYIHIPKISIKEEHTNVKWLLDQGYMPEAIINYLLLLTTQSPCEIFSLQEALCWFDIKKTAKTSSFDIKQLRAINIEHIKRLEDMELSKRIGYSCANLGKLAKLYAKKHGTTLEIKEKIDTLFQKKKNDEFQEALDSLKKVAKDAPYFEDFHDYKAYLADKSDLSKEELDKLLRFLLTGTSSGLELSEIYPLIKNYLQEIIK